MKKEKHESWNKCNHYATDENGLCVRCGYNTLGISNKYKIDKMHEDKMHEDYLIRIVNRVIEWLDVEATDKEIAGLVMSELVDYKK